MAISFKCGNCAKTYTVKDELAGKRAQCKNCGQVMKIPALSPHREPDLRDDGSENPAANAETVAGSLIASPLETVAGRGSSASGRSAMGGSAAGRSAAGRSAAGRSASHMQAPPESDYGQPPLSALKHVPASDHEAFDVTGGTDQPLRQGRGPASKNYAPGEPYSFLLIVLMLAALGFSAYSALNNAKPPEGVSPEVFATAGKPMAAVILSRLTTFVVALAVIAPLIMGAWYAACKIINVRLPSGLFLRSAGLAALPVAALTISEAIPAAAANSTLIALAVLPIAYALLHFVHVQKPAVAGITVGLGTLLAAGGVAAASSASTTVDVAMRQSYDAKVKQLAIEKKAEAERAASAKPATDVVAPAVTVADTVGDKNVAAAQAAVDAIKSSLNNKKQTQTPLLALVTKASGLIEAGKTASPARAEWATLQSGLDALKTEVAAFPTATPPAEITQAPPAGSDWSVRAGRREVSAFAYNLTPPLEGTIDLESRDTPGGVMRWQIGDAKVNFTLEQSTSAVAEQQRPWIAPAFVVSDAKNGPFAVAGEGDASVEYGTINSLPAAKIVLPEAGNAARATYVYAVHKGANWLKCTIGPVATGDAALSAAQQSIGTLHERSAADPVLDPLPATELVARFQSEPAQADKIVGMLKAKPMAEEAVTKALGLSPDDAMLEKFGPLLVAVATEKTSHTLWKLAAKPTKLGDSAREKLSAIEPKTADDIAFAVLDIKGGSSAQAKKGLNTLAYADFDKGRQPTISKALATSLETGSLITGNSGPTLEAVMAKWMDDDLARKVQSMLDTESAPPETRKFAMHVLGATGKQKYAFTICKWLLLDTPTATETLIQMGPSAEPEVAKHLADKEVVARKAALVILNEIGTQRSMSALQVCATKSGDPDVKEAAKALILKIKEQAPKPGAPK